MHFVVASALRMRHARLLIAQAFRTWHTHFPSLFVDTGFRTRYIHFPLFVCRRRLRGIHTFVCQHRLLERGIHAFPLSLYRLYMRFRSCERDPATKTCISRIVTGRKSDSRIVRIDRFIGDSCGHSMLCEGIVGLARYSKRHRDSELL